MFFQFPLIMIYMAMKTANQTLMDSYTSAPAALLTFIYPSPPQK